MKVNDFSVEIGVEGVLIEENRASSVMAVEATSKKVIVDNSDASCKVMTCTSWIWNLLFRVGTLNSSSIYSAASPQANDWIYFCGSGLSEKVYHVSSLMLRENLRWLF